MNEYYVSYRYENSNEVTVGLLKGITPMQVANYVIKNVLKISNAKATKIKEFEIDNYRTVIAVKSYIQRNHINYYTLIYNLLN